MKNRYALLTVDTEALPKRAEEDHVRRLMWGEHEKGTAGVREMASIGNEFGAKHVFFVDMCGAYERADEIREVMAWLNADGQDVELHTHPEYLPDEFWQKNRFRVRPKLMNRYTDAGKELFLLSHFADEVAKVVKRPVRAFRAGSFRWNNLTLNTLKKLNIPLSFNNTVAAMNIGQNPCSVPLYRPFYWQNGILEVPVTEKNILPSLGKSMWGKDMWARFQYPLSLYVRYRPWWASFIPYSVSKRDGFLVCLIHSWSLLYWDENGFATYKDDRRLEGYRRLLRTLSRDYDIITTKDLLDLVERGEIVPDKAPEETVAQPSSVSPLGR